MDGVLNLQLPDDFIFYTNRFIRTVFDPDNITGAIGIEEVTGIVLNRLQACMFLLYEAFTFIITDQYGLAEFRCGSFAIIMLLTFPPAAPVLNKPSLLTSILTPATLAPSL